MFTSSEEINQKIKEASENAKLADFDPFLQRVIKEDNIDFKTEEGFKQVVAVQQLAFIINYYGGSQYIIMKRNLEAKYGRELTDEQIIQKINCMKPSFFDRYSSYSMDLLNSDDRAIIYQNTKILADLKDRGGYNPNWFEHFSEVFSCLENFDFHFLVNKYACICNVKQKIEFDSFGMQDFINKKVPQILERKTLAQQIEEHLTALNQKREECQKVLKKLNEKK